MRERLLSKGEPLLLFIGTPIKSDAAPFG